MTVGWSWFLKYKISSINFFIKLNENFIEEIWHFKNQDRTRSKTKVCEHLQQLKTKIRVSCFWFLKTIKHLSKITITFDPITWRGRARPSRRGEGRTDGGGGPGVMGGFLPLRRALGFVVEEEGGICLGSFALLFLTRPYVHSKTS